MKHVAVVGHLEAPTIENIQFGETNVVSGWAFFPDGTLVEEFQIICGQQNICSCEYGLERNDVFQAYPNIEGAKFSGFVGKIYVPSTPAYPLQVIILDNTGKRHKAFELDLRAVADYQNLDVIREISPQDGMYQGNVDHYFQVGFSALKCIRLALLAARKPSCERILDLPCGHGRVLRTLKAAFPRAQLTACDLHKDGVDFCARVFGAIPVYSNEDPRLIPLRGPFDLIWCGSLLTHLNQDRWSGFLEVFESLLSPRGLLVFTAHGRQSVEWMRQGTYTYGFDAAAVQLFLTDYERQGFAYFDYPGMTNYGISVSSPSRVLAQVERFPKLRLLTYLERGWDDHQDVAACLRPP